jgi:molybdopterin-guanine dinucleotide biosynthesis protein A
MGFPKAMLPFGPELLLQRIVRVLRQVVSPVVVVGAESQELPALPGDVRICRDRRQFQGPLEGIAVGLAALAGDVPAAYVSGCDTPLLHVAFVQRLIELMGRPAPQHASGASPPVDPANRSGPVWDAVVPRTAGYFHPLAAVYRTSLATHVERMLADNRLRPAHLFDEVQTRVVSAEELHDVDPDLQSLRNVNRPEDYLAALRACGYDAPPGFRPTRTDAPD